MTTNNRKPKTFSQKILAREDFQRRRIGGISYKKTEELIAAYEHEEVTNVMSLSQFPKFNKTFI